jgi:hypothetical protein
LYAENATIGTTSTSLASNPTVLIQGTSEFTEQSPLRVINNGSTTSNGLFTGLAPNLPTNSSTFITFGKSLTGGNAGQIAFSNRANTIDNEIALTMFNENPSVLIKKNSLNDTLKVNGGIVADSITLNSLPLTYSRGQVTNLELRHGSVANIGGNDPPPVVTLHYDPIFFLSNNATSPVQNRAYTWQQIGLQYSFSLNLKVRMESTSTQLHLVYLHTISHNPPVPAACGSGYEIKLKSNNLADPVGFLSTAQYPFGVCIPCT